MVIKLKSRAQLSVQNIKCRYKKNRAVDGLAFELSSGQLACLLGPSGCGKTTVLRAIAGFHNLSGGEIYLNGQCIADESNSLPPEKRGLSMVFQDHALFPHLTVANNVAAGLHRYTSAAAKSRVGEMLARLSLQELGARYPHEISGGQAQRVALARALAPHPRLLLMDEPFSNLDLDLREKLRSEIRDLLKDIGTTALLVTHDQQDAFAFGEQVGVMRSGKLEQLDSAYNLYHRPRTRFVADFIGDGVFLDGVVTSSFEISTELALLTATDKSQFNLGQFKAGDKVQVLIRPDDILHDDASPRSARIVKRDFRGENYLYTLALPSGKQVLSLVPSHHDHAVGEGLGIKLDLDHLVVFPAT